MLQAGLLDSIHGGVSPEKRLSAKSSISVGRLPHPVAIYNAPPRPMLYINTGEHPGLFHAIANPFSHANSYPAGRATPTGTLPLILL